MLQPQAINYQANSNKVIIMSISVFVRVHESINISNFFLDKHKLLNHSKTEGSKQVMVPPAQNK